MSTAREIMTGSVGHKLVGIVSPAEPNPAFNTAPLNRPRRTP